MSGGKRTFIYSLSGRDAFFFSFNHKISRLCGIYRNARGLIHAFPLFVSSYLEISRRGSKKDIDLLIVFF